MRTIYQNGIKLDLMVRTDAYKSKKGEKCTIQFLIDNDAEVNESDIIIGYVNPDTASIYEILELNKLPTSSKRIRYIATVIHRFESPKKLSGYNLSNVSERTKDLIL